MEALTAVIDSVNSAFWTYLLIPLLALVSIYFGIRTRAVQLRLVPDMIRDLTGKPEQAADGGKSISSFQAFSISAAARVGTGNIAGVAIAIALGGPGAVLWMWIMGIVMGSAAFVESTLAQAYKVRDASGYRGGPAYYMQHGLKARWLGVIFAVVITFTFGFVFNMVQANSIVSAISSSIAPPGQGAAPGWLAPAVGIALVVITGIVVIGGVRRIANVAQTLVPFMAGIYLLLGIAVVAMNIGQVPVVLADIFASAFGIREIGAAALGTTIMMGIRRGMFSNEAGMGSAPNAGATASVTHPVKQGLAQTFGIYFDTLIVCSITAFIILVSKPVFGEKIGAELTQHALQANLGSWSLHLLTFIIFLLAFTSVIGNYFYGESNISFLTTNRTVRNVYRGVVLVMIFLGSISSLKLVWSLADVTMGVMALVNLAAIVPLAGVAIKLLKDYSDQRKQGLDPVFTRDRLPEITGIQCWEPRQNASSTEPESARQSIGTIG